MNPGGSWAGDSLIPSVRPRGEGSSQTGPWTVLVQVVERGNVHVARTAPYKKVSSILVD